MKLSYINHVPIAPGELSVILAESAEDIMRHSCALALKAQSIGMGTLIINCGMSDRRFKEKSDGIVTDSSAGIPPASCRRDAGVTLADIFMRSSTRGNLIGDMELMKGVLGNANIGTVIIAGWEWTSSSWRRKERLLFYLRELMEECGITVIVYSQATTNPTAGKNDRGGIGKLAMLAVGIVRLEASEDLESVRPKVLPMVIKKDEWEAAERSAQLLVNKMNELQGENAELGITDDELGIGAGEVKVEEGMRVSG